MFRWLKHRIKHKLEHFSLENLKAFVKKNGLPFVVIFILWEIVEDIVFPAIFIWLGNNVDPWFLAGAPISWILCLHPFVVPVLFLLWLKLSGKKKDENQEDDNSPPHICS